MLANRESLDLHIFADSDRFVKTSYRVAFLERIR